MSFGNDDWDKNGQQMNVWGGKGEHIHNIGNTTYIKGSSFWASGNMLYGSHGETTMRSGDMLYMNHGRKHKTVQRIGNSWHSSDFKRYDLIGSTLYCFDGRTWWNVPDAAAAEKIIATDY